MTDLPIPDGSFWPSSECAGCLVDTTDDRGGRITIAFLERETGDTPFMAEVPLCPKCWAAMQSTGDLTKLKTLRTHLDIQWEEMRRVLLPVLKPFGASLPGLSAFRLLLLQYTRG